MEARGRAIEEQKEALRRRIVEEERQKLLKRHAEELLGFLPKVRLGGGGQPSQGANKGITIVCSQGLLREGDLQHFNEDFRRHFEARQADVSSEDGWEDD